MIVVKNKLGFLVIYPQCFICMYWVQGSDLCVSHSFIYMTVMVVSYILKRGRTVLLLSSEHCEPEVEETEWRKPAVIQNYMQGRCQQFFCAIIIISLWLVFI